MLGKTVALDYIVPYRAVWAPLRVCLRNVDKPNTPLSVRQRRLYFRLESKCRPLSTVILHAIGLLSRSIIIFKQNGVIGPKAKFFYFIYMWIFEPNVRVYTFSDWIDRMKRINVHINKYFALYV